MSAGHSPTPLAAKLGPRDGHRVALIGAPDGSSIDGLPDGVRVTRHRSSSVNAVVAFFRHVS